MGDPSEEIAVAGNSHPARAVPTGVHILWSVLAILALILAVGAVAIRLQAGSRFDGLLMLAACFSALMLALRIPGRKPAAAQPAPPPKAEPHLEILDSAGPALVAVGADLQLTYVNPAAERLLGYDADDLKSKWTTADVLAPGEGARLVGEMQKLCGVERPLESTPAGRMAAYLDCVRTLPPSMVPSFGAKVKRKDGALVPVMLHISGLRDGSGAVSGLVAIAFEQTAIPQQELGLPELQERGRAEALDRQQ